ncbi:MAG: hypothetical protein ABH836_08240 [Candidatus Omnitrophota bacterium]
MIYYFIYRIAQILVLVLPLDAAYWLSEKAASIWFVFNLKDRAKVEDNLKIIFAQENLSEPDLREKAKEVFVNFGKYMVEFLRAHKLNRKYINTRIKFNNLEVINSFKGKGIIFLSAHLGNWELGAAVIAEMGIKLTALALTHSHKNINVLFRNQRESHGVKDMPLGTSSVKNILRGLKKGESLAILGDRDFGYGGGIKMDFFKKPALIPKGPAFFHLKTGCPIVPIFVVRQKDNSFTFFLDEPIIVNGEITDENMKEISSKIVAVMEKYIKNYSTQWLMIHRLWDIDNIEREEII